MKQTRLRAPVLGVTSLLFASLGQAQISFEPMDAINSSPDAPTFATYVAAAPGDASRLFILDAGDDFLSGPAQPENGQILVVEDGQLLSTEFLDLPNATRFGQGVLSGLAFHPDYQSNGRFFVMYTTGASSAPELVIEEYGVSANPNVAASAPVQELLRVSSPVSTNHQGGRLQFGPVESDGRQYLFASIGDGGSQAWNQAGAASQDPTTVYGKILRLDPDNAPNFDPPGGNPSFGPMTDSRVYSIGLRNPYGFSLDPVAEEFWIADVGELTRGEVNRMGLAAGNAGLDFEWPCLDGTDECMNCTGPMCPGATNPAPMTCVCPSLGTVAPAPAIFADDSGGAIIGTQVYRGANFESPYYGDYFYYFAGSIPAFAFSYDPQSQTVTDHSAAYAAAAAPLVPAMGTLLGATGGGVDSDGEHIVIVFYFDDNKEERTALMRMNTINAENYCGPAVSNSTGLPSRMVVRGSSVIADDVLTIRMESMPPAVFGFFLVSDTQGFVAAPNGSVGNLCLGGSIGRYVGPGQIMNSSTNRAIELSVDLGAIAQPNGPVPVMPGDTWNFQGWHRDLAGGMTVSNFSDGIRVEFQ